MDWARTKLLAVEGGNGVERIHVGDLATRYPPPRRVYVDAAPTIVKDRWIDLGYEVFYSNTRIQQKLRVQHGLSKSDSQDASLMFKFQDEIDWHRHIRTEPLLEMLQGMLNYRRALLEDSKKAAQRRAAPMYKDPRLLEATQKAGKLLRGVDSELRKACKNMGLHSFHEPLGGVGCLTALVAVSKRPWIYDHQIGGWLHAMGCTASARPDYPTRHSLGCDSRLKTAVYGARIALLRKGSPWRRLYDEEKARLPEKLLRGKAGRGTYKVTAHARATNRVVTAVVKELFMMGLEWANSKGFVQGHGSASRAGVTEKL